MSLSLTSHVWRDETRALSLALQQPSFGDLLAHPPHDGHPLVWFILIRSAFRVFGDYWVLKLLAVVVAAAMSWLVIFKSPFPLLYKALIIFSGTMIFDYAVRARNYGISCLLMFLFAHCFTRERRNPIVLASILFLLANTNVHSAILTVPLGGLWIWDEIGKGRSRQAFIPLLAMLAGIGTCFWSVYPPTNQLSQPSLDDPLVAGFRAVLDPGTSFHALASKIPGTIFTVIIVLAIASLRRSSLIAAAVVGTLGLSLFFTLVYPGANRHEGLWIAFMITLMWIGTTVFRTRFDQFSRIALTAILATQIGYGVKTAMALTSQPYSRSADAAELIANSPCLREAIVVSDPDYLAEALPYYVNNPIYSVREQRFTNALNFRADSLRDVTLGQFLDAAELVGRRNHRPVVLLMRAKFDRPRTFSSQFYSLTISADDIARFKRSTKEIASLRPAITDEAYDVFELDVPGVACP